MYKQMIQIGAGISFGLGMLSGIAHAEVPAPGSLGFSNVAPSVRTQDDAVRVSRPVQYRSAQLIVNDPEGVPYNADVQAQVRYPLDGDGPFPVVLYLHGRHVTCSYAGLEFLSSGECDLETDPVLGQPTNIVKAVDSYKGYDYMARNLAGHGYVVISIDANDVNDKDLAGDAGVNARSQLILHHLDILREINAAGSYAPMDDPYALADLRGKIDMDHVGIMGHSRGGQAVTHALSINQQARTTLELGEFPKEDTEFNQPHRLTAVFALAPTNFDYITAPDTTFAVLLPYCDGDVSNLQGAFIYDDSRFIAESSPQRKFQLVTMGANHNFYNTIWAGDDYSNADSWCDLGAEDNGRDQPLDQRRHGEFLMSSFFRLFVGNEQQFAPYWHGSARLPEDACPQASAEAGEYCDDRVHLSIQTTAEERLVIEDSLTVDALSANDLGGMTAGIELEQFDFCSTQSASGRIASDACPSIRTWSTAGQLYLKDSDQDGSLATSLLGSDVRSYDTLSFRAGLPVVAEGTVPPPELYVSLTDLDGNTVEQAVTPYSLALYTPPGDADNPEGAKTLLNMVRLPLSAFAGIDFSAVEQLQVRSAAPLAIQITDLQLQAIAGPLVLEDAGEPGTGDSSPGNQGKRPDNKDRGPDRNPPGRS